MHPVSIFILFLKRKIISDSMSIEMLLLQRADMVVSLITPVSAFTTFSVSIKNNPTKFWPTQSTRSSNSSIQVSKCHRRGSLVTHTKDVDKEIVATINAGNRVCTALRYFLSFQSLWKNITLRFYNSLIKLADLYGNEMWTMTTD